MKKVLFFLGAVLFLAAGCNKEGSAVESLELTSDDTQIVSAEGGTAKFTFKTGGDWKASVPNTSSYSWASIMPTSGGAGENTVTVTVLPNKTNDDRNFHFTISSGTLSKELAVMQIQKDGFGVVTKNFNVEHTGGDFTVDLLANASYTYSISDSWITAKSVAAAPATKALEQKSVTFTAADNPEFESRTATITFTSGSITEEVSVKQDANVPYFEIVTEGVGMFGDPAIYLEQKGGSFSFEINSNLDFVASTDGSKTWLAVSQEGSTVTVSAAAPNTEFTKLEDWVYINCSHNGEEFSDYGAMIHVYQNELKLFESSNAWSNNFANLGLTSTTNNRMAYSNGNLLICDGTAVVAVNPATGEKLADVPLPEGVKPYSIASDDAGNVLIAVTEPVLNGVFQVYTISSLSDTPAKLIEWVDDIDSGDCAAGNLRVRGNVKANAVVSILVPVVQYAVVWEITDGKAGESKSIEVTPKNGDHCWNYANGVVAPIGPSLSDGLYMGSYSSPYDLEYYDGSEWKSVVTGVMGDNGWGYSLNNLNTIEYNGVRYMAFLSTPYFDYFDANLFVYMLKDSAAPTLFYDHQSPDWSEGGSAFTGSWGGDVLFHAEDDCLALYVLNSCLSTVSRIDFK